MMTQIARKEIDRIISMDGLIETIRYIIHKQEIITKEEMAFSDDIFACEEEKENIGITRTDDWEIVSLDVDKYVISLEIPIIPDHYKKIKEELLKKLELFKGYIIWFKRGEIYS